MLQKGKILGFTIIELMIVMGLLGVLATVVMVNYPGVRASARDSRRLSDLNQYRTALEVYANANDGAYPPTGQLSTQCGTYLSAFTSSCPDDPQGSNSYQLVTSGSEYYIYAKLEKPDNSGSDQYQYFCSTGTSGTTSTTPSNPC